ncbi:integrase/recombinase XerD [Ureibacillus xyleni]|uniref:Integrase/recombinase XerD n=1 Tax=Ureibacillus xyleni TaxID=614648 RepID=A0A285R939_9BACL|nr:tyrosine-type recombinase/integrase [Ureibacillus xyleni]SOB90581.1 integrase/recombinase XerD [Ureibacillus xyleni]
MIVQPNFDLPVYTKKFFRHLKRKNYSPETINGYEKDLKKFTAFMYDLYDGYILTEEINKDDILEYLDFLRDQTYKPNSIARYFSSVRSLYKYLVIELDFKTNPTLGITTRNVYVPLPEILDPDEMKLILSTAKELSELHYALLNLIYYTGSRITAARTLLKQNIDLKNNKIYFPRIKGGRDLYLPLHPTLHELLSDYMLKTRNNGSDYLFPSPKFINKPISAADVRVNLKKIVKQCNITKRVTPHVIRHCTATHLTLLGVDQKYIASVLGHTDFRSTARYQHLNVEDLRPAMEKLT